MKSVFFNYVIGVGLESKGEYFDIELNSGDSKSVLEALNSDLVCDAINVAMRELFLQIVYGRTQTAFSENGLSHGFPPASTVLSIHKEPSA